MPPRRRGAHVANGEDAIERNHLNQLQQQMQQQQQLDKSGQDNETEGWTTVGKRKSRGKKINKQTSNSQSGTKEVVVEALIDGSLPPSVDEEIVEDSFDSIWRMIEKQNEVNCDMGSVEVDRAPGRNMEDDDFVDDIGKDHADRYARKVFDEMGERDIVSWNPVLELEKAYPAGIVYSTGSQDGGQETTVLTAITQLVHHKLIFVPIGYTFGAGMFEMEIVKGGSPYGARTFAGRTFAGDGLRQLTTFELENAFHQEKSIAAITKKRQGISREVNLCHSFIGLRLLVYDDRQILVDMMGLYFPWDTVLKSCDVSVHGSVYMNGFESNVFVGNVVVVVYSWWGTLEGTRKMVDEITLRRVVLISATADINRYKNYRIFVSTWNVGGKTPNDCMDLEHFLLVEGSVDIYVCRFQEIVPLRARNPNWNTVIGACDIAGLSRSWDPGKPYTITWSAVEYFDATGTILSMLLKHHSPNTPHLERCLLHHTILCGNPGAVKVLLKCGADIDTSVETTRKIVFRPIHMAARLRSSTILHYLINSGCDLNSKTDSGDTALMICAIYKHEENLRVLAKAGADFGFVNFSSQSVSSIAGSNVSSIAGSNQWILGLQRAIIDVIKVEKIPKSSNLSGFCPLLFAAETGDVEALSFLKRFYLLCCYDYTQCKVRNGFYGTRRSLYLRYTIQWVDADDSLVPIKVYILDFTDSPTYDSTTHQFNHHCKIEYEIESCSITGAIKGECIDKVELEHFVLIPNCKNPLEVADFTPISLCNIVEFKDPGDSKSVNRKRPKVELEHFYDDDKLARDVTKRATELQANLAPEFPSVIKHMLKSHVTGGFWLSLPKKFCTNHLPEQDTTVILEDECGRESKTIYLAAKSGLSGGRRGFSIAHNLLEGDVIVFQVIEHSKLKVYLVRRNGLDDVDGALSLLQLEASIKQMDDDEKYLIITTKVDDTSLAAVIKAGASREHELLAEIRDTVFSFIRQMEPRRVRDTMLVSVDCFLEKTCTGQKF